MDIIENNDMMKAITKPILSIIFSNIIFIILTKNIG